MAVEHAYHLCSGGLSGGRGVGNVVFAPVVMEKGLHGLLEGFGQLGCVPIDEQLRDV